MTLARRARGFSRGKALTIYVYRVGHWLFWNEPAS